MTVRAVLVQVDHHQMKTYLSSLVIKIMQFIQETSSFVGNLFLIEIPCRQRGRKNDHFPPQVGSGLDIVQLMTWN